MKSVAALMRNSNNIKTYKRRLPNIPTGFSQGNYYYYILKK